LHDYFRWKKRSRSAYPPSTGRPIAEMVEAAKTRGGHDNITGITVQILTSSKCARAGYVRLHAARRVPTNPFADEPTETSSQHRRACRAHGRHLSPDSARQTQPIAPSATTR